jgi:hypothetical protein
MRQDIYIHVCQISVEASHPLTIIATSSAGIVGSAGVKNYGKQDKLFSILVLILVFAEALGLYGLIVALIITQKGSDASVCELPTA